MSRQPWAILLNAFGVKIHPLTQVVLTNTHPLTRLVLTRALANISLTTISLAHYGFLSVDCYHLCASMKRILSTTSACFQSLATSFLLVGLLSSSSTTLGAKNPASLSEVGSGPTSIRSAATPVRNYALTTLPGQRTASDASRQNHGKHSVIHGGAPSESGPRATVVHQLLVTTDRSLLYLSFRSSRPGGRAPPSV